MSLNLLKQKVQMDFYEVSVGVIKRLKGIWPFDIYIKRSENAYSKLFLKDDTIDQERVSEYNQNKGVQALYVHTDDYRKYTFYVEEIAKGIMKSGSLNPENTDDLADMIKELSDLAMMEIFVQNNIDVNSVHHANLALKGCISVLRKEPQFLSRIIKGLAWHPYQLKHAMMVSLYSIIIAKLAGITSEKNMEHIALGGLLHDLGMSMLSFDPETKTELTANEMKEIKTHPQTSRRILESTKIIPWEVRTIAFQHHEQVNGLGYPNGIHDKEIFFPSKIVSVADGFSALTSSRPYRKEAYSSLEAIHMMMDDKGHYDHELLKLFMSAFIQKNIKKAG